LIGFFEQICMQKTRAVLPALIDFNELVGYYVSLQASLLLSDRWSSAAGWRWWARETTSQTSLQKGSRGSWAEPGSLQRELGGDELKDWIKPFDPTT
jgi:hypothetical protein